MANIQKKKNRPVHVVIMPRDPNKGFEFFETNDYEIAYDIIAQPTSRFTAYVNADKWKRGDYVMVKYKDSDKILFTGIVDGFEIPDLDTEPKVLNCMPMEGVMKTVEIPATYIYTGQASSPVVGGWELHMSRLVTKFITNSVSKQATNLTSTNSTNTTFKYKPSQTGITPTNMLDYFVNGFKKYRAVWAPVTFNTTTRAIVMQMRVPTKNIKIKDNVRDFSDWSFTTTVGTINPNMVYVYNPVVPTATGNTQNSETIAQRSYWYMYTDGSIVQGDGGGADLNRIQLPTQSVMVVRQTQDATSEDKQLASDALSAGQYAHEFKFLLDLESEILNFDDLEIGMTADITFHGKLYKSVFTGYNLKSKSATVELTFGHNRNKLATRLREKLE
ncbi:gp16 [Listeria phage P35]|uniref:Uncharacterized protein n=1 Tax=Listeria phage LP-083-1 TaxID=1458854 RepID=A0A059T7Z2_9CAUD|nr:tail protein [Listeria phage P35]AAY53201.1 gp16 [Listeria phage P35]AHL18981.1 hypothetical protein LP083-1_016 [Listeria phage LP-083-1]